MSISYLDYRAEFLNYMSRLGFIGMHDLLYACMPSLMHLKEQDASIITESST